MGYIWVNDDYQELLVWFIKTRPERRIKMFRPSYGVVSEGPDGYSQEVGLAGLVNDY